MKLLPAVDLLYKEAHSLICDMMLPSGMWTISVYFKVCMMFCSSQPDVLEITKSEYIGHRFPNGIRVYVIDDTQ